MVYMIAKQYPDLLLIVIAVVALCVIALIVVDVFINTLKNIVVVCALLTSTVLVILVSAALTMRAGSPCVQDLQPQQVCIVDQGVYTRNRAFRLYLSTKFGKCTPLLPLLPLPPPPAPEVRPRKGVPWLGDANNLAFE